MKNILFLLFLFGSVLMNAQEISIELFAENFNSPLHVQNAGDDRLFVVEQFGKIKILNPDGTVNPTSFLDISGQISSGGERGLLGLAFHPDYANNGYFYVNYTKTVGSNLYTQISRFSVSTADPDVANPNSELQLLEYLQPFSNHNGGCLAFGPDGFLYIASGDGGSGGDPGNRAQNTELLLGKLLRIDVDNPSGGNNYGIPADNPFANDPPNAPEIWAYGLRNPWRFSFDFTENNLWIGDVGQNAIEEIDKVATTEAGLNYGWRCYEGDTPFNTTNCPDPSELTFPIAQYTHAGGSCSITGGYVYRGTTYNNIAGLYFFGDYCSGKIGSVDANNVLVDYGNFPGNWVSFGEDMHKELYLVDIVGGDIYKLKGTEVAGTEDFQKDLFILYPNPAKEQLTVRSQETNIKHIAIFDSNGRVVFSEETSPQLSIEINTAELSQGIYFLKITSEEGASSIKKLVKN
ncbi:MAG: PQQ-dependent sugar dehydrogenase [Flavobacteriaceae bacterium]